MMAIVEGPPGSGKSFKCVNVIADALDRGKPVATNIALSDGWQERLARMNWARRLLGRTDAYRRSYDRNFFMSADITELMSIRLRGDQQKESRGVMVLDEAHVWLNARSWNSGDRDTYLRFFSAHRHLGWDIYLITQRAESIDNQIRALAEYRIFLRNLKRVKVAGVPIVPFNFFVAIWTWESIANEVVKRETYPLRKKKARLYNSLALAEAGDLMPANPIWMPHDPTEGQQVDPAPVPGEPAADPDVDSLPHARGRRTRARDSEPAAGSAPDFPEPAAVDWPTHDVEQIAAAHHQDLSSPTRGVLPDDERDARHAAGLDDQGMAR